MSYTFKIGSAYTPQNELNTSGSNNNLSNFVWNETPTGETNGVNRIFLLSFIPDPQQSLQLFSAGLAQSPGIKKDFILSGSSIIFSTDNTPLSGTNILAHYVK